MWITKILGFIRGRLTIYAEGSFLERFLNICMHRDIFLYDVKRRGSERIEASIGISSFKKLRSVAKKTRTRVRIKSRHGLPFILHRYKRRRLAVLGLVLFLGVMWFLSSHIIGIDITGNERLSAEEVRSGLKQFGLYQGAAINRIDPKALQIKMMTAYDDIAWIGINIKGSRAYIEVKERLDTQISDDTSIPCNLVASRDAIVRLLEVKAGQTVVKVNSVVEKGDLLVSGAVDSKVDGFRYVHSFGSVFADTRYSLSRVYPLKYTEKQYTGKKKTRFAITLFGKELKLYADSKSPYKHSDEKISQSEYSLFWGYLPSILISRTEVLEYTPVTKTRSLDEAVALGKEELCAELLKTVPKEAKINDTQVTHNQISEQEVEVCVEYLCYEDIAVQSVIDKIENIQYDIVDE